MSSISVRTDIAVPLVAWIRIIHPSLTVIWTRPNAPRPSVPYIGLELTTPIGKPGHRDDIDYIVDPDDEDATNFNIGGQRTFTVTVNAYQVKGPSNRSEHDDIFDPHDLLEQIRDAIENPVAMESLHASGLAVWTVGDILDLTELIETGYESRYSMDLGMGIASNRQADLGAIQNVTFQATADGEEEDPITVSED